MFSDQRKVAAMIFGKKNLFSCYSLNLNFKMIDYLIFDPKKIWINL